MSSGTREETLKYFPREAKITDRITHFLHLSLDFKAALLLRDVSVLCFILVCFDTYRHVHKTLTLGENFSLLLGGILRDILKLGQSWIFFL